METLFDIVAGVLQGNILAPYLFIICLDYILQTPIDLMKENGLMIKIARGRWYLTQTIMEVDYADDVVFLANIHTQAESLQHNLEQAAGGTGHHVNVDKTEYMYFNRKGDTSTLNGGSLKLVDKFLYLANSISSTENDNNMGQAKAWTVIDRLSIIWKSDLSNKIKCNFFQAAVVSNLPYGCWLSIQRKS